MESREQINTGTVAGDKGAGDIKSRKQINTGTVAGDKEAADGGVGSDLIIRTIGGSGCKRLETFKEKRRGGKTWTVFIHPHKPDLGAYRDAAIDYDYIKELEEQLYGSSAKDKKKLKKHKELVAKARGVPYAGCGSELGVSKCGREATKEEKTKEEKASGGEDEEACDTCGGKWHRPLTIEPPCVPIPGPQCYVACQCCNGDKFEEKTGDCAHCGSTLKGLLQKYCPLCRRTSHFDNSDKECKYYGKENAKIIPFHYRYRPPPKSYPSRGGLKIRRRQPIIRKKLAKKQKELAAEDTVVPGEADA